MMQSELATLPRPITGPVLRDFLRGQRIIRGAHVLPSAEACERLAARLEQLACVGFDTLIGRDDDGARIAQALQSLAMALPPVRRQLVAASARGDVVVLDQLAAAVAAACPQPWATPSPPVREISRWQEVALEHFVFR